MVAYVLIPKVAFDEDRDALLERARKDSGYGCFQHVGGEVRVAFAYDASACFFGGACARRGIQYELELGGIRYRPEQD
jgi:hypothetical protein